MHRRYKYIAAGVMIFVLISACSSPATPTTLPGLERTLAVRTMIAMQGSSFFATATLTANPVPTTVQPLFQEVPASHFIEAPTATPVPSLTPFMLNSSNVYASVHCRNRAEFVRDVTFDDLSEVKPGQEFTKAWKLRNVGDCTWSPDYSIVFTYGDQMQGLSPKPLGIQVAPGEAVIVSLDLVAPKEPNFYQGNWMLQDNYGTTFSCGSGSRDYIWVSVIVGTKKIKDIFGICGGGGG